MHLAQPGNTLPFAVKKTADFNILWLTGHLIKTHRSVVFGPWLGLVSNIAVVSADKRSDRLSRDDPNLNGGSESVFRNTNHGGRLNLKHLAFRAPPEVAT